MPTFGPGISVADLQKYVGDYTSKDIPLGLKIFVKNNGLFAQGTGQPEFPLEYAGDHQFKFDNYGVKIRFYLEKQQMELQQNSGTFLFDKKK